MSQISVDSRDIPALLHVPIPMAAWPDILVIKSCRRMTPPANTNNLSSFGLIGRRLLPPHRNDTVHRKYTKPHERRSSEYAVGIKERLVGDPCNVERWTHYMNGRASL
jgi:hypothetical protein